MQRVFADDGYTPLLEGRAGAGWQMIATDVTSTPWLYLEKGQKASEIELGTWGKVVKENGDVGALRFAGQRADAETGLYYNRHRYYAPDLHCFITPDPLGMESGALQDIAFVPNATMYINPSGLTTVTPGGGDPSGPAPARTDPAPAPAAAPTSPPPAAMATHGCPGAGSPSPSSGAPAAANGNAVGAGLKSPTGAGGSASNSGGCNKPAPRPPDPNPATPTAGAGGGPKPKTNAELAAEEGDDLQHRLARYKVSKQFYDQNGMSGDFASQRKGIDFNKPVQVVNYPPPDQVHQYVRNPNPKYPPYPDKAVGQWVDPKGGQTGDQLGLNTDPNCRQPATLNVPPKSDGTQRQALQSTAAPITDNWTDKNNPVATNGGGTQWVTTPSDRNDIANNNPGYAPPP